MALIESPQGPDVARLQNTSGLTGRNCRSRAHEDLGARLAALRGRRRALHGSREEVDERRRRSRSRYRRRSAPLLDLARSLSASQTAGGRLVGHVPFPSRTCSTALMPPAPPGRSEFLPIDHNDSDVGSCRQSCSAYVDRFDRMLHCEFIEVVGGSTAADIGLRLRMSTHGALAEEVHHSHPARPPAF